MKKFIDFCFPKNNEEDFIKVALKLETQGICFLYNKVDYKKRDFKKIEDLKKKYSDFIIYDFCIDKDIFALKEGLKNKIDYIDETNHFDNITKNLTQVFIKKLKENNNLVGVSFSLLKNNTIELYKHLFFLQLCKKYKVSLFIGSFAKQPLELKDRRSLFASLNLITKDTSYSKKALYNFYDNLSKEIYLEELFKKTK